MKLAIQIQLNPTKEQAVLLDETLSQCNEACNFISKQGWNHKVLRQFDLHKVTYFPTRELLKLSAQATVRCIAKVADSYKTSKKRCHKFRKYAAQPYDARLLRFCNDNQVSIWTMTGREKIKYTCGTKQQELLAYRKGEVDLMFIRKKWYLSVCCDIPDTLELETTGILGIDLGIVNLAVDSNGTQYSGKGIEAARRTFSHRRKNLQKKGTKSAKRKLKKLSGRQSRYQKNTNHCISKTIVQTAERYAKGIALENLKGITKRVKVNRRQRTKLSNWGFYQLKSFIQYKAKRSGIPVFLVDPRNTSRTCTNCGCINKRNRASQAQFKCIECDFAGHADYIAALNIRARATVNKPNANSKVVGELQGQLAS